MIQLKRTNVLKGTASLLPASKSISNRALIINALAGGKSELLNLSDANDTQLMLRLVSSTAPVIDVEDAGTTMRFLTAYFSVSNKHKTLTGTSRMKERPIGILVDALRSLGTEIRYTEKEGYPPLETLNFGGQKKDTIRIRGDISSQFISALMMIAPILPNGLTLELEGKVGSKPYIEMTAAIMKHFGVDSEFTGNKIIVAHQSYKPESFTVESDWSAASYWFALTALADDASLVLPKLYTQSLQGDSVVAKMMELLGVDSKMQNGMLHLVKKDHQPEITWDFTHCPDLAQTIAVVCAAKGIRGNFTGLESLRIKETDRIAALQHELKKIGADLQEIDMEHWTLIPSKKLPATASFETYKDHRMAMAFAPLATKMTVEIDKAEVVRKSYPNFWNDLKSVGIEISGLEAH